MHEVVRKKYCVDGEWRISKTDTYMPVTDSSTGEVIAEVPCCTVDEWNLLLRRRTPHFRLGRRPLSANAHR